MFSVQTVAEDVLPLLTHIQASVDVTEDGALLQVKVHKQTPLEVHVGTTLSFELTDTPYEFKQPGRERKPKVFIFPCDAKRDEDMLYRLASFESKFAEKWKRRKNASALSDVQMKCALVAEKCSFLKNHALRYFASLSPGAVVPPIDFREQLRVFLESINAKNKRFKLDDVDVCVVSCRWYGEKNFARIEDANKKLVVSIHPPGVQLDEFPINVYTGHEDVKINSMQELIDFFTKN